MSRDFRPLFFLKSNPSVPLILIFSQHLNIRGGAKKKLLGVTDTDTVLQYAVSLIIRNVNDTAESKSRA